MYWGECIHVDNVSGILISESAWHTDMGARELNSGALGQRPKAVS